MVSQQQRRTLTVRLLGRQTDARWRQALIAEGCIIPTSGTRCAALIDLQGADDIDSHLRFAVREMGTEPVIAVLGMDDALPRAVHPSVVVVRANGADPRPVLRAISNCVSSRLRALTASIRLRALTGIGRPYPAPRLEGADAPVLLLTEPGPDVLSLLSKVSSRDLVAPLSSSHTLRLLESFQAGALIIHLGKGREHRLPVLKLIRRQSDLQDLPVAVISESWDAETAAAWLGAGADLIAKPDELEGVLRCLGASANRFVTERSIRLALLSSSMGDDGVPCPIFGEALFERIAAEHSSAGDPMVFGAIELRSDEVATEQDYSEAGVYLAMALSPLDVISRPRENLFLIAMPHADKFYAGRTMRTLQTLIEDLKFGQDPNPVLVRARTAFTDKPGSVAEILEKLSDEVDRRHAGSLLHA
ncbi:hypothetical protein HK107_01105 [Parvularcula sp. ZS-1/3]|uniref:Uncharacterized protein n=1 Tax=Parvularcula mediterranea TaxID=2732508 RepID=A0A7Y3W3X7_9PROT|nr:hypothetical protein [Parvularcula mediterranea]NNU14919.1 hypothetical protein [Parvularcula mediterranea]